MAKWSPSKAPDYGQWLANDETTLTTLLFKSRSIPPRSLVH